MYEFLFSYENRGHSTYALHGTQYGYSLVQYGKVFFFFFFLFCPIFTGFDRCLCSQDGGIGDLCISNGAFDSGLRLFSEKGHIGLTGVYFSQILYAALQLLFILFWAALHIWDSVIHKYIFWCVFLWIIGGCISLFLLMHMQVSQSLSSVLGFFNPSNWLTDG